MGTYQERKYHKEEQDAPLAIREKENDVKGVYYYRLKLHRIDARLKIEPLREDEYSDYEKVTRKEVQ